MQVIFTKISNKYKLSTGLLVNYWNRSLYFRSLQKTFFIIFVVYKKHFSIFCHQDNLQEMEELFDFFYRELRETFFYNQLNAVHKVTSANKADFKVNDKYTFEVGGKNKGHGQIMGLKNAYLALDNLEYGFGNKIPLWLFGMLY